MAEPATILVVDDNSTNRMKMRMVVRNFGHTAEVAENGAVALQMLRESPFDAVLLDIVMPEVDGYEVLKTLKADENLRDIPVIVISSLVLEVCAECHAVLPGQGFFLEPAPLPFKDAVPLPLEDIANTPGITEMALLAWMTSTHPTMPDIMLEAEELRDVVVYILSLKNQ